MKKIKYLLFSLLLIIPLCVYATENPKVTTLESDVTGKTINYNGTMETGSHAVMCKLYDSSSKEIAKLSSAVDSGKFSGTFEVTETGEYKLACANYEGGAIKELNVTVAKEDEEIKTVNIALTAPVIGEKVTVTDDEQSNAPVATTDDNIEIGTEWISGLYTEIGDDFDKLYEGTFEEDKYYYACFEIEANDGYSLASDLTIKVNGEKPAEVFAVYNKKTTRFIVKIKAEAKEETKDEATEDKNEDSPNTGDKLILYASILAIGVIGFIVVALLYNKKLKKNN